ncbi:hydroxyacid dehydrogenase [Candidatus Fermentibacteria bacterium]|nr:hydroxyacid dehydrogenase [Candidatus Fermentibacteria bacterium]
MLILISDAFDKGLPATLARFGEVTDDKARLPEATVVLVRSKTKCTKEYMDGAPQLKLIIRGGVGLDNVDREYAKTKGIIVKNTPAASSIAVAELAMALMSAISARVIEGHMTMANGQWAKKELKRTELYGKTLGLIGAGRIASEVAKRAKAFGMNVIAYDPYLKESDYARLVPMDELLASADYVSLHTPLTDETKGMINADAIAKMKDGVVIINSGRGKCINEPDLAAALRDGKVRAFGTDVWFSDPPPADCPLLTAPNVFMTPHIGAETKENLLRIGAEVEKIIESFAASA